MRTPKIMIMDFTRWLNKFVTLDTAQTVTGTKKFGTETDYTTFETDGTLVNGGNATTWKDINVGGVTLTTAAANQPTKGVISTTNILTYLFNGTSLTNELHGAFELQHDYKEGTDIVPHLHWYPTTTASGNVRWYLDYWIRNDNTTLLTGTLGVTVAASNIAWDELRSSFAAINGSTLTIGSQVHFRIYRNASDGSDTYGADVGLGTFGIHYQCDTMGSRDTTTK